MNKKNTNKQIHSNKPIILSDGRVFIVVKYSVFTLMMTTFLVKITIIKHTRMIIKLFFSFDLEEKFK